MIKILPIFSVVVMMLIGALLVPVSAFADCANPQSYDEAVACGNRNFGGGSDQITTFAGLLNRVNDILNATVPFLIGLGVFVIIYGVFGYITHSADEEKRAEARQFVLWGIIGVCIMLSIWGLISVLTNTFVLDTYAPAVDTIFPSPY